MPFEDLDFYDLFRVTFENSELGRMKRLLPLHEMAVNFGLVSKECRYLQTIGALTSLLYLCSYKFSAHSYGYEDVNS